MSLAVDTFDWPFFALKNDIPRMLANWRGQLGTFALATLVARTGSSPQPVGCQMLVGTKGHIAGYVSGGCVESNLAFMAQDVIKTRQGQFLAFGADSPFIDVQLPCGTRIELAVEAFDEDEPAITTLLDNAGHRTPSLLAGDIESGERLTVALNGAVPEVEGEGGHLLRSIFQGRTVADLPVAGQIGQMYWKKYTPTPRLIINGGDPVAVALALLAQVSGFEVIINRSHGPTMGLDHPEIGYRRLGAQALMREIGPDAWTAIVTTSHNMDSDHDILMEALPTDAFYVGVLGSRHHLVERQARLLAAGMPEATIQRLRAPVGMDIGAEGPNEIAVSIIADLIRTWRGK